MIKAVAGGGGRGMRVASNEGSLIQGYHTARLEADKAFGNPDVYIEKFIINPHHIEFQIFADEHGPVVHLGSATAPFSDATKGSLRNVRHR